MTPLGAFVCDRCRGLGWIRGAHLNAWPLVCPRCRGRGSELTLARLAWALKEHRNTLYRLNRCTTNGATSLRLLNKLARFLER